MLHLEKYQQISAKHIFKQFCLHSNEPAILKCVFCMSRLTCASNSLDSSAKYMLILTHKPTHFMKMLHWLEWKLFCKMCHVCCVLAFTRFWPMDASVPCACIEVSHYYEEGSRYYDKLSHNYENVSHYDIVSH